MHDASFRYVRRRFNQFEIVCDCGIAQHVKLNGPFFYVIEPNVLLPMLVCPAWCFHCGSFVESEDLQTLAVVAVALNEVENSGGVRSETVSPTLLGRLSQLSELIEKFTDRQSRARCLRCGQTDIKQFSTDPETGVAGFGHPGCSGVCRVQSRFTRVNQQTGRLHFTSEGFFLPLVTVTSTGVFTG